MESNPTVDLVSWFISHCNGIWEHSHGFCLNTLDNPGIVVKISLNETELENRVFKTVEVNYDSDTEWYTCEKTDDGMFVGNGSPDQLEKIIRVFLEWADSKC